MITTPSFKSWVVCLKPNPHASLRLFCFPHAGGSASSFRTLFDNMPRTVEVCTIEAPGRGRLFKSIPFTRLKPLIGAIATNLLPYLNKPFAFFGHSMGGVVSFELARLLRSQHRLSPVHLFVSACCAPQIPLTNRSVHALPESEFLKELNYLNGIPKIVLEKPKLMPIILPIIRADIAVVETYIYMKDLPLDCSITVFGGLQDPGVTYENLKAWQEQTTASFSLQMFSGDHFFIHSAKEIFLQKLSQDLYLYL